MATNKTLPKQRKKPAPAQDKLDALGIDAVCAMIVDGMSYRDIAKKLDIGLARLCAWFDAEPERAHACARARETAGQTWDEMALESIRQAKDHLALSRAREEAIHLRWRAKAANPKRYADKVAIGGADDLPPIRAMDLTALSPEELAQMEALLAKAKATE